MSWREESAPPVIAKVHKGGKVAADPLHGLFALKLNGKACVVEYEPDTDLRDSEQIPLLEEGGIEAFILREVLPFTHMPYETLRSPRRAGGGAGGFRHGRRVGAGQPLAMGVTREAASRRRRFSRELA